MDSPFIRRALVSVSDKRDIDVLGRALQAEGITIYASGGTHRFLEAAGIAVVDVAEYTGFPEMLDGRLKTLHPKLYGGILARHDRSDDLQSLAAHEIAAIELVVVNLYPFEQTIARADVSDAEAIEQIDIGGPALVRAAAKNHRFVTVATSPDQYGRIVDQIRHQKSTTYELRRDLALAAFDHTAKYDAAIAAYFRKQNSARDIDSGRNAHLPDTSHDRPESYPTEMTLRMRLHVPLRYGENPHQRAAVYQSEGSAGILVTARKIHGKELSYNNLLDLDSGLRIAAHLPAAAAVVIKHNNPCGAAVGPTLAVATSRALQGDPLSAFGSILGLNETVDQDTAEVLAAPGLFIEAIVAPDFSSAAVEILTTRPAWRHSVRLLATGPFSARDTQSWQWRPIDGGMLVQEPDVEPDDPQVWQRVTTCVPDEAQIDDLSFAWSVVRHVKSNAIVVAGERTVWGVGAGQMSRVDSVAIALRKAGDRARGGVLASDAFFPFPDSIELAANAGIAAIVQPGGSKRDDDVVAACNRLGISMLFTGRRHFLH